MFIENMCQCQAAGVYFAVTSLSLSGFCESSGAFGMNAGALGYG